MAVLTQLYFQILSWESTTCFGPFGPSSGRKLNHKERLYSAASDNNNMGGGGDISFTTVRDVWQYRRFVEARPGDSSVLECLPTYGWWLLRRRLVGLVLAGCASWVSCSCGLGNAGSVR